MAAQPERSGTSGVVRFAAPMELEEIDPRTTHAINAWLRARGPAVLQFDAVQIALAWSASPLSVAALALEIQCGVHEVLVAIEDLAVFEPLLVGEPFALLPDALRELIVQRALAGMLTSAPRCLAEAANIRRFHWDSTVHAGWPHRTSFTLRRLPDGAASRGVLAVRSPDSFTWLNEQLPANRERPLHELRELRIGLRLALGTSVLAMSSLRELERGDVVWIQSARIDRHGLAIGLQAAQGVLGSGRAQHRQIHLQRIHRKAAMNADSHDPDRGTPLPVTHATPLQLNLEIPISFDLGELPIALAELEHLQPGAILELPQDVAEATVNLRVAGSLIAHGQLVSVGKRIGVRISRVYLDPQQP